MEANDYNILYLAYPADCQKIATVLNFRYGPSSFPNDSSRVLAGIPR